MVATRVVTSSHVDGFVCLKICEKLTNLLFHLTLLKLVKYVRVFS